jgi:hypothetical protein
MPSVPSQCPECGGPLDQCTEPVEVFGQPSPGTCGALFCPEGHGIVHPDAGKCPLGKETDCPALASATNP